MNSQMDDSNPSNNLIRELEERARYHRRAAIAWGALSLALFTIAVLLIALIVRDLTQGNLN